jgi:hypothetical protein
MKNMITFFRFKKSNSKFDSNQIKFRNRDEYEFKKYKNLIEKNPNRDFKELNKKQSEILLNIDQIIKKSQKEFEKEFGYNSSIDLLSFKSLFSKKKTDIEVKFYNEIKAEFDMNELMELFLQKEFNYDFKRYNDLKESVENYIPHERIEIIDMNELNSKIDEMNTKGWNIKQIEGVQSSDMNTKTFTEGILIVWKK